MTATISNQNPTWRFITGLALLLTLFSITGCGSTKVYSSDKTLVLHGDMFNVSKFEHFSSKVEGTLPGGDVVDLQRASKSDVNGYLKQGSPIRVTTGFVMDQQTVVYESKDITKYSQFSSMKKSFDRANGKFQKFMSQERQTQLVLK